MMKQILPLLFFGLIFSTAITAQSEDNRDAITVRAIANNFIWPLDNNGFSINDFNGGVEFEFFRYLNDNFDLSVPVRIAAAKHPLNATGTQRKKSANLGLDVLLNYNIYKGDVFRPRLFAGAGGLLLDAKNFISR